VKVFVSYSRKDAEFVARIQRDLTGLGYDVWVDTEDMLAGGQARWRRSIVAAIRDAEVMVLVLSPNSTHSDNVERELSVAADNSKRVVPILFQECELPDGFQYDLAGVQHIDFTKLEFTEGVRQLGAYLGPARTLAPPVAVPVPVPPPPPPAPVIAATTTSRWKQPRILAIIGAAAAVLLIGGIVIAANGGGDGTSAATDPTDAFSSSPETAEPSDTVGTDPAATTETLAETQGTETTPTDATVPDVSDEDLAKAVVSAWTDATTNRDWAEASRLDTGGRITDYDQWYGLPDAANHMVSIEPYFVSAVADGSTWTITGAVMAYDMSPAPKLTTNVVCSVWIVELSNGTLKWGSGSRPAKRVPVALDPSEFESNYADYCA
jgi:hypothetical protein